MQEFLTSLFLFYFIQYFGDDGFQRLSGDLVAMSFKKRLRKGRFYDQKNFDMFQELFTFAPLIA